MTKTMPAGEFDHRPARARQLARDHDVVIESRGRPTAVLISFERYQRLTQTGRTPVDLIADESVADIEFEIPRFNDVPDPGL